jgi:molybdopterin synthase sulfur carrier subunit
MHLELKFFATFRAVVGQKIIEREFPDELSVGDVLSELQEEYPDMNDRLIDEEGEVRPQLSILKNGRDVVHKEGADTHLEDGDTLSIFPPVAGGTAVDGTRADSGGG